MFKRLVFNPSYAPPEWQLPEWESILYETYEAPCGGRLDFSHWRVGPVEGQPPLVDSVYKCRECQKVVVGAVVENWPSPLARPCDNIVWKCRVNRAATGSVDVTAGPRLQGSIV